MIGVKECTVSWRGITAKLCQPKLAFHKGSVESNVLDQCNIVGLLQHGCESGQDIGLGRTPLIPRRQLCSIRSRLDQGRVCRI